ncbi:hypothetical protein BJ741DRAFT_615883 [Chytriomyces cf. hyalinus JEL632]|nr:hypothetical protein BJ741DRAFT_615883 [Chytriomyces cf. hyalinus JEL632]
MSASHQHEHANPRKDPLSEPRSSATKQSSSGQKIESLNVPSAVKSDVEGEASPMGQSSITRNAQTCEGRDSSDGRVVDERDSHMDLGAKRNHLNMGGSALTDGMRPSKPDAHDTQPAEQSMLPEHPGTHADHANMGWISMTDTKMDDSDSRKIIATEEHMPSKHPEARSGSLDVSRSLMMDDVAQPNAGGYSGDHQLLRLSKDAPKFPASGGSISERDQSEHVEGPGIRNWLSKELDSASNRVHQPPTDGNIGNSLH